KSGKTEFWMKHCSAVPLGKNDEKTSTGPGTKRTPQTCNRCQTIMYPGPKNSPENHKLGYCSDGVSQKNLDIQWPQPQGIFTKGKNFYPIPFLKTLRLIYDELIIQKRPIGELTMESQAFVELVGKQ
ncbi:hypothetical protein DFH05DRAFT_1359498, partial [Lentinula detonsa]